MHHDAVEKKACEPPDFNSLLPFSQFGDSSLRLESAALSIVTRRVIVHPSIFYPAKINFVAFPPAMLLEFVTLSVILAISLYALLPRLLAPQGLFAGPKSHWLTGTPRGALQACNQADAWSKEYGESSRPPLQCCDGD